MLDMRLLLLSGCIFHETQVFHVMQHSLGQVVTQVGCLTQQTLTLSLDELSLASLLSCQASALSLLSSLHNAKGVAQAVMKLMTMLEVKMWKVVL